MEDSKVRVLLEDIDHKFKVMTEMLLHQGKKIDALFEMVAKNTEDIEMIKMRLAMIENEIKLIRDLVKDKADKEKVQKLEKSILILKRKIA